MTSSAGSALVPNSRTTLPFSSTWPSEISSSALRREATPACARIFCKRSCISSSLGRRSRVWIRFGLRSARARAGGRRIEDGGGALGVRVGVLDRLLELQQRGVALMERLLHLR